MEYIHSRQAKIADASVKIACYLHRVIMKSILTNRIYLAPLILLAILIAYFRPKSNDIVSASNSSHKSRIAHSPRGNNSVQKVKVSDYQASDRNVKNPHDIVPSATIYDVHDINAMIKAAFLINDDEERCQKLKKIAQLWTLIDPDACLKWSLSIANDKIGYEYISAKVISTLVENNQSEKAIEMLSGIPKGKLRDTAIGYGIWSILDLGGTDMATAERLLTMLSSKEQMDRSVDTLSKELIKSNKLHDLKEMYDGLSFGMLKESVGSSVLRNLASMDPLAGLDWIRSNQELNNIENYEALAYGFSKLDPIQGINIADEINDTGIREKYLSYLLNGWAAGNHKEAGKWITDQISNKNFDQMKNEFFIIARKSFAHDENLLFSQIENITDQSEKNAAILSAAAALSEYNPRNAAELALATLTRQPEKQVEAVAITVKNWLIREPLEASKWIGDLKIGPMKDAAVSELVTNILSKDKDMVMANSWAAQIRDPKIRAQVNAKIDKTKP